MTPEEVARTAAAAGFTGDGLVTIVAIAGRESRYNPNAIGDHDNPRKGCGSFGLVQINSCPGSGAGNPRYADNPTALLDPLTNMKAAFTLSKGGTDFQPWMSYRAGIAPITPWMAEAKAAAAAVGSGGGPGAGGPVQGIKAGDPLSGPLGAALGLGTPDLGDLATFLSSLADPTTYKRLLWIAVGLVLFTIGALALAYDVAADTVEPN